MMSGLLGIWAGLAALALAAPVAAYTLGEGGALGGSGFTAGGYLSVRATALDALPASLGLQDLSLLLRGALASRWQFFSEIELEDAFAWAEGEDFIRDAAELEVERLYVDHTLTPAWTLRLGKYLTPVGRWNQIHADPLVWSVWRPLTTASAFARHASGLTLIGHHGWGEGSLEAQFYLDQTDHLDPRQGDESDFLDAQGVPNPRNAFDRGAGLHLRYRSFDEAFQLGLSLARFTLTGQPGTRELLGLDLFHAADDGGEFLAEAVYRRRARGAGVEWGGFVQYVQPLPWTPPWGGVLYGVWSQERYRAEAVAGAVNIGSLGLTYRPRPPISWKLEYREAGGAAQLAPDGWLGALSILF